MNLMNILNTSQFPVIKAGESNSSSSRPAGALQGGSSSRPAGGGEAYKTQKKRSLSPALPLPSAASEVGDPSDS